MFRNFREAKEKAGERCASKEARKRGEARRGETNLMRNDENESCSSLNGLEKIWFSSNRNGELDSGAGDEEEENEEGGKGLLEF